MKRKIPATMVSQHPDHASSPYWQSSSFISTYDEVKECYLSFAELGVSEYKWDWEGKLVDESVIERLLHTYYEYFKQHPLGKEKFLTFRLPNPKVESEFRLGRAFMGILSAASLAKAAGLHSPPLFELILPMTETAQEMMDIQEAFKELISLRHPLLKIEKDELSDINVIPLFEHIDIIMDADTILKQYVSMYTKKFKKHITYLRPYMARSDPALNAGIIPTVLSIKVALSKFKEFEKKYGIAMYPIIGSASLPFRGNLNPQTIEQFLQEYAGIKTALLQSAFRYDYPQHQVLAAIQRLEEMLPKGKATSITKKEEQAIRQAIPFFTKHYQATVEEIADDVNRMAANLPRRRERLLHTGLFGYSRGVGKVKLPRAIGFTAAMYSLGVPPEFVGSGRGLKKLIDSKSSINIEQFYLNFKTDFLRAGGYVQKTLLNDLAKKNKGWQGIKEDVESLEKFLGIEFGPSTTAEKDHARIVQQMSLYFEKGSVPSELIEEAGKLRKSLG